MRFKPGQEVVCTVHVWTYKDPNTGEQRNWEGLPPNYNDLVEIESYRTNSHCFLVGFNLVGPTGNRIAYNDRNFEPVIDSDQLEDMLNEVTLAIECKNLFGGLF